MKSITLVLSLIISLSAFAEGYKPETDVSTMTGENLQPIWQIDQIVQVPVDQSRLQCTDMSSSGNFFSSYIKLLWPEYSSLGGQLETYTKWGMASSNNRERGAQCEARIAQYIRWAAVNGGTIPMQVRAQREIQDIFICEKHSSWYGACEDGVGRYTQKKVLFEKLTITFPDGLIFGTEGIVKYLN